MSPRNRLYVIILIFSAFMTVLNISIARSQSDHTLFDPLIDVVDLIQNYYVTDTEEADLVTSAIDGMLSKLDPYSEYIPADDMEEFDKRTSGSYEGIGIAIDVKNGYLTVISPFEDSPAWRAGVRPGDIILEVEGKSTKGWSSARAVKELTGSADTQITIRVMHRGGSEETLTITRGKIHIPTVRGWLRNTIDNGWDFMLDPDSRIGYVRITQFTADTPGELDRAVDKLRRQDMEALIMDLRSNPGGIMTSAVGVVDRMIDHGIILTTRGEHTSPEVKKAHVAGTWPRFHLIVLIDQGSASASEIVAGALQDHGRAVIVGKRSWGKGSVQRIVKLPDSGGVLKLTTDYYYLPNGRCVHRRDGDESWGVTPDIEEDFDSEYAPQLRELMERLTVPPLTAVAKKDTLKNELAEKLLRYDSQLAQALKQCRNLIRTRPPLTKTINETNCSFK